MPKFRIDFDMSASVGGKPSWELYAAALEMASYADKVGIDYLSVQEHHGADDGYITSPFLLGAAVAARTHRLRIQITVILPFHDPVKIAEQIAVLDHMSNGRL